MKSTALFLASLVGFLNVTSVVFSQENYGMELIERKPIGSWVAVYDLLADSSYLYIGAAEFGLQIVDRQTPDASHCIGIWRSEGKPVGRLHAFEHYLIVEAPDRLAPSPTGITIIDISNPSDPVEVAWIPGVWECDLTGTQLHGIGPHGYDIYSIADPTNPSLITHVNNRPNLRDIAVSGTLVCFSDDADHLFFIDVSDSANPRNLITLTLQVWTHRMTMDRQYLRFIDRRNGEWRVFDISDRHRIHSVAQWRFNVDGYAYKIVGDNLFVATGDGLLVSYNCQSIDDPREIDRIQTRIQQNFGGALSICWFDNLVYIGQYGIHAVDATQPDHLSNLLASYGAREMHKIMLKGDLLFVAYYNQFRVYDISHEEAINELAIIPIEYDIEKFWFDEAGYLYVTQHSYTPSLRVYDVSDLEHWRLISQLQIPVFDLKFRDNLGFAAVRRGELIVLEVSDPTNIRTLFESQDASKEVYSIVLFDNIAYTASHGIGLRVYNVADPSNPQDIAVLNRFLALSKLAGRDNYLVGLQHWGNWPGFYVIDCSDRVSPTVIGGRVIADPCDVINAPGGRFVYTAEGEGGVKCYNISDDFLLWETGNYETDGFATGVAAKENSLFVGDVTFIERLDCSEALAVGQHEISPQYLELSAPFPNPFNSSTTIEIALPTSEDVTINLVDISGRAILEKAFGRLSAGRHSLTLSAEGVPSGLYFVQATVGGKKVGRRVVVMR